MGTVNDDQGGLSHAVHSTAWWSRSEGPWKGPETPIPARFKVPNDHRPAHSRGLSKPIKPTGQLAKLSPGLTLSTKDITKSF